MAWACVDPWVIGYVIGGTTAVTAYCGFTCRQAVGLPWVLLCVCVCGGVKSVSCTMLFIDSPLAMPSGPPTPRHTQWTGPGLHMCEILQHAGIIHVQAPKLEPKQGQYASSGCCKGLSDSIDDNRQCPLKRSQCLRKNLQTTKWPH